MVYIVYTVYTVNTVYTVEMVYTVYTVDMVYTVDKGDEGDHYGKDRAGWPVKEYFQTECCTRGSRSIL